MRNLVRGLALGRIAVGVVMLAKPDEAVRGWIGRRAASYGGTPTVVRGFGARDLSLGAGTLAALIAGQDAPDWGLAGGVARRGGPAAGGAAGRHPPRRRA